MPDTFECYCNGCPYNTGSIQDADLPLSMEHNSDDVLLIFQSPGGEEWNQKRPICNERRVPPSAAARMRDSVKRITGENGEWRCRFSITNAVQCYPGPGDNGHNNPPQSEAREHCVNWLNMDIEAYPWIRIVVFGEPARQSVTDLGYDENDPRFCFIGHPSGGLSNDILNATLSWALDLDNADG